MTTKITERNTNKGREWRAWVGSLEDLRRLATIIDSLAKKRQEILIAESRREVDEKCDQEEQDSSSLEYLKRSLDDKIEGIEIAYKVTVTGMDGDDTTKGEFEAVLDEIDRRTVKSIKFRAGTYGDDIDVEFKRSGYGAGVKLTVTSSDQGWAKRSFVELSEEISKGVPRYSWIRGGPGRGVVGVVSSFLIILAIILMVLPAVSSKDRPGVLGFSFFCFLWLSMALVMIDRLYDWLAPRFELIGQDVQSTGSRRIGAIAGLVGAVVVGIIVNRIYS